MQTQALSSPSAGEGAQPAAHVGQPVQQLHLLGGTERGVGG